MIFIYRDGKVLLKTGEYRSPVIRIPILRGHECVYLKENEPVPWPKEFEHLEFESMGEAHGEIIYRER